MGVGASENYQIPVPGHPSSFIIHNFPLLRVVVAHLGRAGVSCLRFLQKLMFVVVSAGLVESNTARTTCEHS
jgi:hypothetical protein